MDYPQKTLSGRIYNTNLMKSILLPCFALLLIIKQSNVPILFSISLQAGINL